MKHKVSELEGALLDAAVAKAEGVRAIVERCRILVHLEDGTCDSVIVDEDRCHRLYQSFDGTEKGGFWLHYSGKWELAGPIMQRERIGTYSPLDPFGKVYWVAGYELEAIDGMEYGEETGSGPAEISMDYSAQGPTPLVAAMRSFVLAHFGEEVELP